MKKTLLFLTILFFSTNSFTQTLSVSGDTIKSTQDPCFETSASLTITNNSTNALDIHCEKVIIDTALGTQNYFCWGEECYGPSQYVSSSFNNLNPGESDNIDFGGYYNAFCSNAPATIRYCFYPVSAPGNRTCIDITYNGNLTSFSQLKSNSFSIFPNPSNEIINISLTKDEVKEIIIFNVFGEKITQKNLIIESNLKVDLSDYSNGTYFIVAINNDSSRTVKKFILQ
ncbi:T9SS type A sorting domain-containing protein [Bacteroidota bacterium]|nr:T9SS type A sorting domain-containing protein [Bacteroidota bacterium]